MTLSREELKKWVDYARENRAIILFDSAYEAYIREKDVPTAFMRLREQMRWQLSLEAFPRRQVLPDKVCVYRSSKKVVAYTKNGEAHQLNSLWNRRQTTKFNGVPYIIQRAAAAVYTPEGQKQTKETIDYYMENAKIIKQVWRISGLPYLEE